MCCILCQEVDIDIHVHEHNFFNWLAPGRYCSNLKLVIFKLILRIDILRFFSEIALRWMLQHLTDDLSTLVQVMAWCSQTRSHYLSQCWLRSMLPYGIAKPQWINGSLSLYHKLKISLPKTLCRKRPMTTQTIRLKYAWNNFFSKSCLIIASFIVDDSFCNFAESTAVWLLCSVQNCRIHWLKNHLIARQYFARF